jgi:hypothetical protein
MPSPSEPAVVAAAGFTANDGFWPGLVSLLVHGSFLNHWMLSKNMKVVSADCVAEWHDQDL